MHASANDCRTPLSPRAWPPNKAAPPPLVTPAPSTHPPPTAAALVIPARSNAGLLHGAGAGNEPLDSSSAHGDSCCEDSELERGVLVWRAAATVAVAAALFFAVVALLATCCLRAAGGGA
jgi:hypothetical protein